MGKMKKVIYQFLGGLGDGGAETLVKNYALLWNNPDYEIKIVVIFPLQDTATYKTLVQHGVSVVSLLDQYTFSQKALYHFLKQDYVAHLFYKLIKRDRPIAIHTHLANLQYLKPISEKLEGIRLFYTCHSLPCKLFNTDEEIRAAEYLIHHNHLQLIALHEEMRVELNHMFHVDNTIVVRNGIDFSQFLNIKVTKSDIREKISIPEDAFVIGHVGRFSKVKNHRFMVEIFRLVLNQRPNAYLLLIGAGSLIDDIEGLVKQYGIEEHVRILSHRNDIAELMQAMDVFLFPSIYEGLSVTLLEAQVSNVPCVISDTISKENLVCENIWQVPLDAPPSMWAETVIQKGMIKCANHVSEEYNMPNIIKCLENKYIGE